MNKEEIPGLVQKARKVINEIEYLTIATSDSDSKPWNTPVYSAFDEDLNFYWVSYVQNIHSKNINENENIFIVIYDSTVPEGTGFGVYIEAKARVLEEEEDELADKGAKLIGQRKNADRDASKYLGDNPRRVYIAKPEKIWVNINDQVEDKFVDNRIELPLDMFREI